MEIIMCTKNKYNIYCRVSVAYTKCAGKHAKHYLIYLFNKPNCSWAWPCIPQIPEFRKLCQIHEIEHEKQFKNSENKEDFLTEK